MSRRQKTVELWDASHFALVAMWQSYSHLFPRSLHLRSRPVKPSPDIVEAAASFGERPMIFFSAWLSCGHVVQVPAEVLVRFPAAGERSREPKRRPLVPCYKCWIQMMGQGVGQDALRTIMITCSFCGVPHDSSVPCIRPHLER